MRSISGKLSFLGVALLLTHCGQGADVGLGENQGPAAGDDKTPSEAAGAAEASAGKHHDARNGLSQISSSDRVALAGALETAASRYAIAIAESRGLRGTDFTNVRVALGNDGLRHVRMNQTFQGLKVWGADVVVHATAAEIVSASGSLAAGLEALDTSVQLDDAAVLARAKKDRFGSRDVETSRDAVEKIVFVDGEGTPHVAFHASFYNELQGDLQPALWNHVYDAQTGRLLARFNAIDTLSQASGASGNAKFSHAWQSELDVEPYGSSYIMTTARLQTVNLYNAKSGGYGITGPLSAIGDAAINDAHGYAEVTLNMMQQWLGHNSIDDNGFRIVSRVHYGVKYENAFWNGIQMTYGDGGATFYPMSGALDVVAHEINHGFTEKHSGLAYSGEAGGLNESFSDIAGKTAEFFYKANPSWSLGADIFRGSGALRYMCTPSQDGRSIDHASKMTPSLDPHFSSGPPNKAFCRAAKRISSGSPDGVATAAGVRRAATAFYEGNANYWTSSSSYVQACQGTLDAAKALGFTEAERDALRTSFQDVGIYCDGASAPPPACDVTLTTATGSVTSPNYPSAYPNNYLRTWCIDAPAGQNVTVTFSDFATEAGYDVVTVRDKTGKVLSSKSGSTAPAAATSSRVYITLSTDESVTAKGFKANWTSL